MVKKITLALGLGVFLMTGTAVYAAVAPEALCKDKMLKETGKKTLNLLKAFGKNIKRLDTEKLANDVSKAQSKFTKGFSRAEFKGDGTPKGCESPGDPAAIELKVDTFVFQILNAIPPSPSGAFIDGMDPTL